MKGISAVIAAILMLMITMALAGVAYFYITGIFASKTTLIEAVGDADVSKPYKVPVSILPKCEINWKIRNSGTAALSVSVSEVNSECSKAVDMDKDGGINYECFDVKCDTTPATCDGSDQPGCARELLCDGITKTADPYRCYNKFVKQDDKYILPLPKSFTLSGGATTTIKATICTEKRNHVFKAQGPSNTITLTAFCS